MNVQPPLFTVSDISARAKMDQNESPWDLPPRLRKLILRRLEKEPWNHYVQPLRYREAKKAFARVLGLPPERIFLTAGADQVIQAVFQLSREIFGEKNRALIFEPTYPMYRHFARVLGIPADVVELGPEFSIRESQIKSRHTLVNIVSPNNPTGGLVPEQVLRHALEQRNRIVFIDACYAEFSGRTYRRHAIRHPQIIVCRSFSKVRLAGLRFGYGVASPDFVRRIDDILLAPYNIGYLQILLAEAYGELRKSLAEAADRVRRERSRLYRELARLGTKPYPSQGNFILFHPPDAERLFARLLDAEIKVRNVGALPGLKGFLRVTVRSRAENGIFLNVIRSSMMRKV